mmetsp:Transcript_57416/g.171262  ORF Transcript_57416/g.171262 Transcript_57416/m.171262 type:complete len:265 (-) Transcript_57416:404-1198(-)
MRASVDRRSVGAAGTEECVENPSLGELQGEVPASFAARTRKMWALSGCRPCTVAVAGRPPMFDGSKIVSRATSVQILPKSPPRPSFRSNPFTICTSNRTISAALSLSFTGPRRSTSFDAGRSSSVRNVEPADARRGAGGFDGGCGRDPSCSEAMLYPSFVCEVATTVVSIEATEASSRKRTKGRAAASKAHHRGRYIVFSSMRRKWSSGRYFHFERSPFRTWFVYQGGRQLAGRSRPNILQIFPPSRFLSLPPLPLASILRKFG